MRPIDEANEMLVALRSNRHERVDDHGPPFITIALATELGTP
jgi:hypothetical protein